MSSYEPLVMALSGGIPDRVQVIAWVELAIAFGAVREDEQDLKDGRSFIEPKESLAERLGCSPATVREAYDDLVERGLLTGFRGKGTVVAKGAREKAMASVATRIISRNLDFLVGLAIPRRVIHDIFLAEMANRFPPRR